MPDYKHVTVGIPTKNRYDSLALTLYSIINQTVKPSEIIIVDDSDNPEDLRNLSVYKHIMQLIDHYKIEWRVIWGLKQGQHHSHQLIQEAAKHDLIFRIDDDEVADYDVLEKLLSTIAVSWARRCV